MSSSTALQQQLSKLDTPGPVQHYAIAAIFDATCQGTSSSSQLSAAAETAVLQCLCLQDGHAAGVATEKLVEAVYGNKIDASAAQSLLLTALAVASPASAAPLTAALISVWYFQLSNDSSPVSWKSHVLSKALVASPFAGTELISSICKLLLKHAEKKKKDESFLTFNGVLSSLKPFFSFIFLDPTISTHYPQHATNLHSSLVRTAAAAGALAPENQHAMLCMLCSFLPALQVQSTAQQLFVESCVADIMDLLEACEIEPGLDIVNALVSSLFSLCSDISSYGGSIAPFITALATIFSYWPLPVLASGAGTATSTIGEAIPLQLAKLSVNPSSSSGDATAALSLLCSLLLFEHKEAEGKADLQEEWLAAAVSVHLAPVLAFGQLKNVKEWTSRALAAISKSPLKRSFSYNGKLEVEENSSQPLLLGMLWSNSTAARCWLHSLESELSLIETPSTTTTTSIAPATTTILLSLVHHPEAAVSTSAIDALLAAVHAAPLLGITALPVLIHKLHTTVEKILSGSGSEAASNTNLFYKEALASVLPTLYALPRLAVHPSTVAFTVRALQPLLAPPAPDFLQGVALRMLCEMWLTTGRGFPHLRTALLSYSAPAGGRRTAITPNMVEDPALRRAWAASLADVCAQDGERAKDLIHSITECLENSSSSVGEKSTAAKTAYYSPEVQAAGLECVAELCEADILDFYQAWKIVQPLVPTLPQHPVAAAAWLRVLASGGVDAAVYPEISRGILKALWAAARDQSLAIFVRNQACASLAAYDFLVLEENDILMQEMWEFAALLKNTTTQTNTSNTSNRDSSNRDSSSSVSECEELVVHVLEYEHATRRRQQRGGNTSAKDSTSKSATGKSSGGRFPWSNRTRSALAGAGGAQGVSHKLVSTYPKLLLGSGSRDPKEFLRRIPDVTPFAVLLLWSPPPPAPSQHAASNKTAAAAVAAKQAVAAYSLVFAELCKQNDAGFSLDGAGNSLISNSEVLAAWASFLRRWTSAARDAAAAATATATMTPSERTTAGAQAVWQVIKSALQSGENVTVVSSAACAAAALASSVYPQPLKPIVEDVFAILTQHAQHDVNSNSIYVQSAACVALGHCADVARSILGLPAVSAALEILQRHLANADAPPAVRAASAIGLSLAAKQLSNKVNASVHNVTEVLKSILSSLLAEAASQFSQAQRHHILAVVVAAGAAANIERSFAEQQQQQHGLEEVFDAVFVGVAESLFALLAVGLPSSLLGTLRIAAMDLLCGSSASHGATAVHGLCQLLKDSTLTAFQMNVITASEVVETLDLLKSIVTTGRNPPSGGGGSGSGVQNGKLAGAAALALGSVIPSLIKSGFVFPLQPTPTTTGSSSPSSLSFSQYAESLLVLARDSGSSKTMSARASAKQGAAGGIAALLTAKLQQHSGGEDAVVLDETEKQALEVLEFLSIKDEDTRARRGCAHALTALCWSARHSGKSLLPSPADFSSSLSTTTTTTATSAIESSANTVTAKGVAALPDASALRYLCETIDSGAWPEIFEDGDLVDENNPKRKEENVVIIEQSTPLTSEQAAAILRCLAATPRLPVMDWSAACRRLLRTHPGSAAVQKAVVLLFSAHASVTPALQMYGFVSEDIFGTPGFTAWQPEAQHAILKELARLLAALPDAEATSVLRMLCSEKVCPDNSSSSTITKEAVEWQAALLQGLASTSAKENKEENKDQGSGRSSLGQTAWECAVHAVLPKLPTPTTWPVSLKLAKLHHYIQKENTNLNLEMKPWAFLLETALTAPSSALDKLCSLEIDSATFAKNPVHWTWLCAALVSNNGVDLRGLQQPRNYILGSEGDKEKSSKECDDVVLLLVARAVASCPTATVSQKQQWIMDVLHAAEKCTASEAAVKLALVATVALGSTGSGKSRDQIDCFGKAHSVLVDCETALNELPFSLRYFAESIQPCPIALLTSVVAAVAMAVATVAGVEVEDSEDRERSRELQKQCCWALRHVFPSDTWVELYTRVEGER